MALSNDEGYVPINRIDRGGFGGVRQVVYAAARANVQASGNRVWSQNVCAPQFRDRYRARCEPRWRPGDGWTCEDSSCPRDGWDSQDGLPGLPYQDNGYQPDGYGDYRDGTGWYGRYIRDDRYRGDDRWSRGGGPRVRVVGAEGLEPPTRPL